MRVKHAKYWKSRYTFPGKSVKEKDKDSRIKHLESLEHRGCMYEIKEWNKAMHPEDNR